MDVYTCLVDMLEKVMTMFRCSYIWYKTKSLEAFCSYIPGLAWAWCSLTREVGVEVVRGN